MRLAALVESPSHVCCRYRLRAFEPLLAEAGHNLELHTLPRGLWERWQVGSEFREADAVILQRKLLSRIEAGLLRRRARKLFFDFDDAIWLRDSYSSKGFASAKRLKRFRAIVSGCDAIVAGNEYLAEHAERCSGGRLVRIIPTCVDPGRYPLSKHDGAAGESRLVWIGSSSTLRGLEEIAPTLESIGRTVPGAKLKLICDRFLALRDLPTIPCAWTEATEANEIASSDIGISWVPDDPWSRGKCGLKVLQYMAAGLPVVANPIGVHLEMVRNGETGFLVNTEREWIEAVRVLAVDPDLRRRMGRAGRQIVEGTYSIEAGADRWLALLRNVGAQKIPA